MTQLLEKAFAEASKLPDEDQDFVAQIVLDELADEARWQEKFARRPDVLERLADEALAEHARGESQSVDKFIEKHCDLAR